MDGRDGRQTAVRRRVRLARVRPVAMFECIERHKTMRDVVRPTPRLSLVIASNGVLRVAGGANSVLTGVYLADSATRGFAVSARLVGILAGIAFGTELVGALPLGMLADAVPTRLVLTGSALLAALATFLFGVTHEVSIFVASRALEGLAAAAAVPALLAYLIDVTASNRALRARVMSYFELSLLAGLALGGLLGSQLWAALGTRAFSALAVVYVLAALMMLVGAGGGKPHHAEEVWEGLRRSFRKPAFRRLAPAWLCMNTIIGLWLGPTVYFLLTHRPRDHQQLLSGLLADDPTRLGWLLFGYSLIFGTGLVVWSRVLPRTRLGRALRMSLVAMLAVSGGLWLLNHLGGAPPVMRWSLTAVISGLIMVESGFTPAALALLAGAVGPGVGRGSAMGLYSLLLSLGALAGSLLAGFAAERLEIDGLIYVTVVLALLALTFLPRLDPPSVATSEVV